MIYTRRALSATLNEEGGYDVLVLKDASSLPIGTLAVVRLVAVNGAGQELHMGLFSGVRMAEEYILRMWHYCEESGTTKPRRIVGHLETVDSRLDIYAGDYPAY